MFNTKSSFDYTTRDYEGFRTDLIKQLKNKIPEYTDFSESDVGIVLIELLSYGLDIQSYYLDRVANEVHLHTALDRGNVIELCKNLGYSLKNATASELIQVFEVNPTTTDIVIPKGFLLSTSETATSDKIYFETQRSLVIPKGQTGLEKDLEGNYLYTVPIVQGFTIQEELLGSSDGTADQEFNLYYASVLEDTIKVMVDEGNGSVEWTKVDNFLSSSSTDRHYTVSVDDDDITTIKFGSGSVGMIPPKLDENITVSYRVGGGTIGNVTKGVIVNAEHNLANIVSTENISVPTVYGTEKETIEEAKRNAILNLRTHDKAVTLQDYEDLAYRLNFTYISKAEEVPDGRTINIYILPKNTKELTEEQIKEATELYEEYKMIGTNPIIKNPVYVPVNLTINCQLTSNKTADLDHKQVIQEVLEDYFSLGNFKFKQTLSKANLIYNLMELVPDIMDVTVSAIVKELQASEILTLGTVDIQLSEV